MLKIGDFSRLTCVTVKTLRYYDRLGLLKPAWIDRFSGYRYYNLKQIPRLNRILALKDLGFSLDQIGRLLDEDLNAEQIHGMLRLRQAELERHLQEEQSRLMRVQARLEQIQREGMLPQLEVLIKAAAPQAIAAKCDRAVEMAEIPQVFARLRRELASWLESSGVKPEGPWITLYTDDYREQDIPLEIAAPLSEQELDKARQPAMRDPSVDLRILPPVEQMASLVHVDGPQTLLNAYTTLYAWVEANRFRITGPARELHHLAQSDPYQAVEIQFPVEALAPIHVSGFTSPIEEQQKESEMQPKMIEKPGFTVVGFAYHGKNENQEIAEMWDHFNANFRSVENAKPEADCYGLCSVPAGLPEGEFEYVAGVEVSEAEDIPEGMVVRRVPPARYAVFEHHGPLDNLHQTYQNIYQAWLPQSGLQPAEPGRDMEVYTDEFKLGEEDSVFYIYVPVKE